MVNTIYYSLIANEIYLIINKNPFYIILNNLDSFEVEIC